MRSPWETPLFRLEFDCDFDQYSKAVAAHHATWARVMSWPAIFGWLVLFTLVILSRLWFRPDVPPVRSSSLAAALSNLFAVSLPLAYWLLLIVFACINTFLSLRPRRPQEIPSFQVLRPERLQLLRAQGWCWVFAIVMSLTAIVDTTIDHRDAAARGEPLTLTSEILGLSIRMLPASIAMIGGILMMFYNGFSRVRSGWVRQPQLQLHQIYEFFDSYLANFDTQSRTQTNWTAYQKTVETPDLFMLYKTDSAFEMIPKRAFEAESDLHQFREYLKERLPRGASGFPVLRRN